jgi:hypothetical protein
MIGLHLRDWSVLCLCALIHLHYRYRKRRLLPLPPGPSGWPVVGNALMMPLTHAQVFYKDLGLKLGENAFLAHGRA